MSKVKFIPTKKLLEILNSPHCTGINGADYEPLKSEMQDALWERQSRVDLDHVVEKYWQEYQTHLDDVALLG